LVLECRICIHTRPLPTITSSAGGNASFLLGPSPYLSLVDITASTGSNGMAGYVNSTRAFASVTQANLSAVLTNYRLVGVGYQVRNLMPPTTATGRLIIAKVPCTGPIPGPAILSSSVAQYGDGLVPLYCGINTGASTTGFPTDILELPDAQEFTLQDIISDAVQITLKPISPAAFDFSDTSNDIQINSAVSMVAGDAVVNATSLISTGYSSVSGEVVKGWDCALVTAFGFPASTVAFEVKYIYHFEGTPFTENTAGALTPGAQPTTHVNPMGHSKVLSAVLKQPSMKFVTSAVSSMADAYFGPGAGKLGGALGSTILSKLGITL
jgi:hypothetical protein